MSTHNFETLRGAIIGASVANNWANAVDEWQVVGMEEDPRAAGICVCGNTGLRYLYKIHNPLSHQSFFPIGSVCINYFGVDALNVTVNVLRGLFELRAAFAEGKRVDLTGEFFSRAVLADLWENGAFPPNEYNRSNGDNDYKFLVDMFNQRHDLTDNEMRKVWVLINRTIKSFVMSDERLN